MHAIRVLLANRHPIIRANLRRLLEREPHYSVLGEAATGREAVMLSRYQNPDVVVLDLQLPLLSGLAAAREIAAGQRHVKSIFMSGRSEEEYVLTAFEAGANGFVLSDALQEDLPGAIISAMAGGRFVSPRIFIDLTDACNARSGNRDKPISSTDKSLLCWLAQGRAMRDIAVALHWPLDRIEARATQTAHRCLAAGIPASILSLIGLAVPA